MIDWIRIEERTPDTKLYLKQPVTHWAYVNTPEDLL